MHQIYLLCLLTLFLNTANAQTPHVLDGLPNNFDYQLYTDSIPTIPLSNELEFSQEPVRIGCAGAVVNLQPDFSLLISHERFFGKHEDIFEHHENPEELRYYILLYAVKRKDAKSDSLLLEAIDRYCIYGWRNFAYESEAYILFSHSMGSPGGLMKLEKAGFLPLITETIFTNLKNGAEISPRTHLPAQADNPFLEAGNVTGKYLIRPAAPPAERNWPPMPTNDSPEGAGVMLKLQPNGKAVRYTNLNDGRPGRYSDNGTWYTDNQYLFVEIPNWGRVDVFEYVDENWMISLQHPAGYWRVE